MNKIRFIFSLILLTAFSVFMISCSDSTTTPVDPSPDPVSELMATTTDSTTIVIKWKASPSETSADFTSYQISRTGDDGSSQSDSVTKAQNPLTVTGLKNGVVYTFIVKAKFSNGNQSTAVSVKWSPAIRFVQNINNAVIKVYETASTLGSGLDLYYPEGAGPRTVKVASGEFWNLGLDTRNNKVLIASPVLINYGYPKAPPETQLSDAYFEVSSLDNVFDSEALSSGTFANRTIDLDAIGATNNVVFILRTKEPSQTEYNYAKVLIKRVNNAWLQGNADDRYIECVVSYQMKPGVPYAKRPM